MKGARRTGYRGNIQTGGTLGRRASECPKCGAAPGIRCFDLNSWVIDPDHTGGGFYALRTDYIHPERRTGRPETPPPSERTLLRAELKPLLMTKLGGTERIRTRRWSESIHRTPEELRERIAQLKAMSDL